MAAEKLFEGVAMRNLVFVCLIFALVLISGCAQEQPGAPNPSPPKLLPDDMPPPNAAPDVLVYTDRLVYDEGEPVKVTVLNNGTRPIYYVKSLCSYSFELYEVTELSTLRKNLEPLQCFDVVGADEPFFAVLQPGESVKLQPWSQIRHGLNTTEDGFLGYRRVPGKYQVAFTYATGGGIKEGIITPDGSYNFSRSKKTIFSSAFELREKEGEVQPPTEEGVFIYTDKTEYVEGKTVKITVINNLDKPIYYLHGCVDEFWINMQDPMPEGYALAPRTYCAGIPTFAELGPNENKTYEWNQEQEVEWGSYKQRSSKRIGGTYKVSFRYFEQPKNENPVKIYSEEFELVGTEEDEPFYGPQEVVVSTDQKEYEYGKRIKITVYNRLPEIIYYLSGCVDVYKVYVRDGKDYDPVEFGYYHCTGPSEFLPLAPGESLSFEWTQMQKPKGAENYEREAGTYRVGFAYVTGSEWAGVKKVSAAEGLFGSDDDWTVKVFSDDFELLPEFSADVWVRIDKKEYAEGELVKITATNRANITVYRFSTDCGPFGAPPFQVSQEVDYGPIGGGLQYTPKTIQWKRNESIDCTKDTGLTPFRPGESVTFTWNQMLDESIGGFTLIINDTTTTYPTEEIYTRRKGKYVIDFEYWSQPDGQESDGARSEAFELT